jgi:hypothetical protein
MNIPDTKERILMCIGKEPTPIHIIAKKSGICITTTSKYIYILQAENKIAIQGFGNMKLVRRKS